MKAVIFGAGNIGRGFIAELITEADIEVVFVDINKALIDAINQQGSYRQVIVGDTTTEKMIRNVRAVYSADESRLIEEIRGSELLATSVGAGLLPRITPVIVKGLTKRWERGNDAPVNILICENLNHADAFLKRELQKYIPETYHGKLNEQVGFVETSIGRMIPVMPSEISRNDPTVIYVEPYRYLPYDSAAIKGRLPHIPMTVPFSPFTFYVERKLFVHNMGHFILALLGRIKGYTYTWEAVEDPSIAYCTRTAMGYTGLALSQKYSIAYAELLAHTDDLLYRFSNKALGDTNERVSREIDRKLASDDRLLGAVKLCEEQSLPTEHIQLGIAAAYNLSGKSYIGKGIIPELQTSLSTGFEYKEIREIIEKYRFADKEMIV